MITKATPTAEEMLAYQNGELDEAGEQRVREALAAWPELARTMGAEFPDDGDAPDIDAQWSRFQQENVGTGFSRFRNGLKPAPAFTWLAVAATVAIAFAGLYWRAERELRAFHQPRVLAAAPVLQPGGSRGPADAATRVQAGDAVRLAVIDSSESYRVELRDSAAKTLWTSASVQADDDRIIAVLLPRSLKPGRYQLVLRGANGGEIATYAVRVSSS